LWVNRSISNHAPGCFVHPSLLAMRQVAVTPAPLNIHARESFVGGTNPQNSSTHAEGTPRNAHIVRTIRSGARHRCCLRLTWTRVNRNSSSLVAGVCT
jgi:hypothetical protein